MNPKEACKEIQGIANNMFLDYTDNRKSAEDIKDDLEETIRMFNEIIKGLTND